MRVFRQALPPHFGVHAGPDRLPAPGAGSGGRQAVHGHRRGRGDRGHLHFGDERRDHPPAAGGKPHPARHSGPRPGGADVPFIRRGPPPAGRRRPSSR